MKFFPIAALLAVLLVCYAFNEVQAIEEKPLTRHKTVYFDYAKVISRTKNPPTEKDNVKFTIMCKKDGKVQYKKDADGNELKKDGSKVDDATKDHEKQLDLEKYLAVYFGEVMNKHALDPK